MTCQALKRRRADGEGSDWPSAPAEIAELVVGLVQADGGGGPVYSLGLLPLRRKRVPEDRCDVRFFVSSWGFLSGRSRVGVVFPHRWVREIEREGVRKLLMSLVLLLLSLLF